MKIIFKFIVILINLFILINCQEEPKFNQLKAYPNTFEAPTMKEQIANANFTAPFLSRSLFEEDPTRKLRQKEFISIIRYSMYNLTRGETEQIFVFSDKNKDDLIDQSEWDDFTGLFILPFESCDVNQDYILNEEEFKTCFDADPRAKLIIFRRRYEPKKYKLLMDTVSTRGAPLINFSDYLFIRRTMFAWRECHSNAKYISTTAFTCALRIAVPQKYHLKVDMVRIYKAGLKLANDPNLLELDFISYVRILYFTYVFSVFGAPHDIPWLEKTQLIKAVREDRFPTNFEEKEINDLYELTNTNQFQKEQMMSIETWCFFFNLHRLFNTYSIKKPLQITNEELNKLLGDPLTPYGIVLSIDNSYSEFEEKEYIEVSMILQRLRVNERDFYYSFLQQDASVATNSVNDPSTIEATFYTIRENPAARKIFFSTYCTIDKTYWTKDSYYRAFLWSNVFSELARDKRWLVPVLNFAELLPNLYETIQPPIGILERNNYVFYRSFPKDINLDLLAFLALESHNFKFKSHQLNTNINKQNLINETMLKIIMKDYGMFNMPDTIIDLAKKGYDTFRRRVYSYEVIKYLVIIQAAASEVKRNNDYMQVMGVKLNDDFSRKFPNFARRFASSPLV